MGDRRSRLMAQGTQGHEHVLDNYYHTVTLLELVKFYLRTCT